MFLFNEAQTTNTKLFACTDFILSVCHTRAHSTTSCRPSGRFVSFPLRRAHKRLTTTTCESLHPTKKTKTRGCRRLGATSRENSNYFFLPFYLNESRILSGFKTKARPGRASNGVGCLPSTTQNTGICKSKKAKSKVVRLLCPPVQVWTGRTMFAAAVFWFFWAGWKLRRTGALER